jgi:hypothetical protein
VIGTIVLGEQLMQIATTYDSGFRHTAKQAHAVAESI